MYTVHKYQQTSEKINLYNMKTGGEVINNHSYSSPPVAELQRT